MINLVCVSEVREPCAVAKSSITETRQRGLPESKKIYIPDLNLTRAEQDDLVRRAMAAIRRNHTIRNLRDEALVEEALLNFVDGVDQFDARMQAALDVLRNRLRFVPVWLNPDEVWIRVLPTNRARRLEGELERIPVLD